MQERYILACKEIELLKDQPEAAGWSQNKVNKELSKRHEGRSAHAIKCMRRGNIYWSEAVVLAQRSLASSRSQPVEGASGYGGSADTTVGSQRRLFDPSLPPVEEESGDTISSDTEVPDRLEGKEAVWWNRMYEWLLSCPDKVPGLHLELLREVTTPNVTAARIGSACKAWLEAQGLSYAGRNQKQVGPPRSRGKPRRKNKRPPTGRVRRRTCFARTQNTYSVDRGKACREVLANGKQAFADHQQVTLEKQQAYWSPLMETASKPDSRDGKQRRANFALIDPVTREDVDRRKRKMKNGASGPDRISRKDLRRLNSGS